MYVYIHLWLQRKHIYINYNFFKINNFFDTKKQQIKYLKNKRQPSKGKFFFIFLSYIFYTKTWKYKAQFYIKNSMLLSKGSHDHTVCLADIEYHVLLLESGEELVRYVNVCWRVNLECHLYGYGWRQYYVNKDFCLR